VREKNGELLKLNQVQSKLLLNLTFLVVINFGLCNTVSADFPVPEVPPLPPAHLRRKVWCYPVQLASPGARLPAIEYMPDREQAVLRWKGDGANINIMHLQKLVFCALISNDLCLNTRLFSGTTLQTQLFR